MREVRYIVVVWTVIVSFMACNTSSEQKSSTTTFDASEIEKSTICVPIEIALSDIEARINSELKSALIVNKRLDKKTKLTVYRQGRIHITGVDGRMELRIPVLAKVEQRKLIKMPPVTFALELVLQSDLAINPNWSVSSTSKVTHYKWIEEPTMEVLGVPIKVQSKVEKVLDNERSSIAKQLDKLVAARVSIKKTADNVWHNLSKHHNLLHATGDSLFLNITPEKIEFLHSEISSNLLTIHVKLDASFEAYGQSKFVPKVKQVAPDLAFNKDSCAGIQTVIITSLTYDDINNSLIKHLDEVALPVLDDNLNITDVRVGYDDNQAQITITLNGTYAGKVQSHLNFSIDSETKQVMIEPSDIDVVEGNLKLSLAVEVLNQYVQRKLVTYGGFEYAKYLSQIPSVIQNAVESGKSGDQWHPDFKDFKSRLAALQLNSSGISFKLYCEGKGAVVVDDLTKRNQ